MSLQVWDWLVGMVNISCWWMETCLDVARDGELADIQGAIAHSQFFMLHTVPMIPLYIWDFLESQWNFGMTPMWSCSAIRVWTLKVEVVNSSNPPEVSGEDDCLENGSETGTALPSLPFAGRLPGRGAAGAGRGGETIEVWVCLTCVNCVNHKRMGKKGDWIIKSRDLIGEIFIGDLMGIWPMMIWLVVSKSVFNHGNGMIMVDWIQSAQIGK